MRDHAGVQKIEVDAGATEYVNLRSNRDAFCRIRMGRTWIMGGKGLCVNATCRQPGCPVCGRILDAGNVP